MSGHSKWSTIKRKKGAADAKRGQIFTRLAREITIAAREGGGDADANFRLRLAVDRARTSNMPKENIDRAIKRGTGELKEENEIEELTYEGFASHGVAMIIEVVTDNRNRSVSDLRHVLNRAGGGLGEGGSVAWQFTRTSYFGFPQGDLNADKLFDLAVEAGADDVSFDDGWVEITGPLESFKEIADALHAAGIQPEEAELRMVPNHELELPLEDTLQVMRILEAVEELDDVQNVYSNLYITEDALSQVEVA
jgi:YebC/PmpR family DNA-binding regulatory protein